MGYNSALSLRLACKVILASLEGIKYRNITFMLFQ
jgi:hypothetical protein